MIINPYIFGGGGGGPLAPHRYWRVSSIVPGSGLGLEITEAAFNVGGVLDPATLTFGGTAPSFFGGGSAATLQDGVADDARAYWENITGVTFNYDFGSDVLPSDLVLGSQTVANRFPTSVVVSYSDDGSSYTPAFTLTGIPYPGSYGLETVPL